MVFIGFYNTKQAPKLSLDILKTAKTSDSFIIFLEFVSISTQLFEWSRYAGRETYPCGTLEK